MKSLDKNCDICSDIEKYGFEGRIRHEGVCKKIDRFSKQQYCLVEISAEMVKKKLKLKS